MRMAGAQTPKAVTKIARLVKPIATEKSLRRQSTPQRRPIYQTERSIFRTARQLEKLASRTLGADNRATVSTWTVMAMG